MRLFYSGCEEISQPKKDLRGDPSPPLAWMGPSQRGDHSPLDVPVQLVIYTIPEKAYLLPS